MIDPTAEPLIPFSRVPDLAWLPPRRRGEKLAESTLYRWAREGFRGVKLEVVHVGGTCCTSEAALKRFFARLAKRAERGAKRRNKRRRLAVTG
jgi:hypothetical protein